jgi:hypothetical protein
MKKISTLLLTALFFFSCKKEDPALFTIPLQNLTFSVNAAMHPLETHYIPINNVKTNALAILDARGMDTGEVKSILPGKARLYAAFGEADLNFVEAVSIRLCPLGENKDNCGREAFYQEPVPFDTGSEIPLNASNIDDIRELVLQDRINIQVKLERLRNFPPGSFDVRLDMEFEVR